jgi:hypothetical protein
MIYVSMHANGEYYWTNNGSKIKVGAHYDSYTFQGNTVVFMVDKILSDEYPYSGYGFCINVGVDQTTANSGISMFTLEGREMLSGKLKGMGGFSEKKTIRTWLSVDGREYHLLGYSAAVVFNPYNAAIVKEAYSSVTPS